MSAGAVSRFILFTDIAGSSRLADAYPREYPAVLDRHNQAFESAVGLHGGLVYKNLGDGYIALFETAGACTDCAIALAGELGSLPPLGADDMLRVRFALHGGELRQRGAEYFGPALNRASRICQVCNPGQLLCSGLVQQASAQAPGSALRFTDLGLHHLRDLAEPERLFQLEAARRAGQVFPPLATLDNRPNNLVEQPNRFIGRARELAELEGLLIGAGLAPSAVGAGFTPPSGLAGTQGGAYAAPTGTARLVTISAPGGYGKSRLAAQLCANLLPSFERGCFMVYLAPLRDALEVPLAIANALGYQVSAGRTPEQQLCDYLRGRELLLCLDNFEHLLERAPLVADILKAAPQVKLLITSREPLRIQGEQAYPLAPLGTQQAEDGYSDAEKLFADRARLVAPDFLLEPGNQAQVQAVCARLAGIPLAIELAAAWSDGFTLEELLAELDGQLELEARTSDSPERHQSLKACLDWSWNLLGAEQQEMLMRLSIFRGGFLADAASAVLGLKGLGLRSRLLKLCDKSWLYTREAEGQTRFYLRDMLAHEYASEKLKASALKESAPAAHAAYFAALAASEGQRLSGSGSPDGGATQLQALRVWRTELENIEQALDTALQSGETAWLLPIATRLWGYLSKTSAFYMMRARYEQLLAVAQSLGAAELLLQAQLGLGNAYRWLDQYEDAKAVLERALVASRGLGDRQAEAASMALLGTTCHLQGDLLGSAELHSQALALRREAGDRYGEAASVSSLGVVCFSQGDYVAAGELYAQALAIRREIGDRHGEASSVANLGNVHYLQGDYERAAGQFAQALAIRREIGDRHGEAASLGHLGNIHCSHHDYARAEQMYKEAIGIRREIGDRHGEASSTASLGVIHYLKGENQRAAELHCQALAIRRELGDPQEEAYSLASLGNVRLAQGDCAGAGSLFAEALRNFREVGDKSAVCICCLGAAGVLAAQGGAGALHAAAVALYGALSQAPALAYHFDPEEQAMLDIARAQLEAAAGGGISPAQLGAARAQGEALSLDALGEYVQAALA